MGYGAPFGAQTIYEGDAAIGGGVGLLGSLGYMVGEHFGLGGFLHYNRATIDIPDNNDDFGDISAWALFYGVEARVAFTSKAVDGWASLGLALGTGQLTVSNELSSCNTTGCATVNAELNDEVTFGVMPTLAFGASARLTPQWGIGPAFRLYVLSIGEACRDYNVDGDGVDPGLDDCTSDTDEVAVPNVAFAGLELTFRP